MYIYAIHTILYSIHTHLLYIYIYGLTHLEELKNGSFFQLKPKLHPLGSMLCHPGPLNSCRCSVGCLVVVDVVLKIQKKERRYREISCLITLR
jgi:hypothetical protein